MKDLLIKELESELLRLEVLRAVKEEYTEDMEGSIKDLNLIMNIEYLSGRIDELERIIEFIKEDLK